MKTKYGVIPENEIDTFNIPSVPRIKFKNYLDKIIDDKIDKISSEILVKAAGKLFPLRQAIKEGLTVNEIDFFRAGHSIYETKLPKFLSPKLVYFLGYFYADGALKDVRKSWIRSGSFDHKFKVGDEFLLQVQILQKLFKQIFDLELPIRTERLDKGENYFYIEMTNKIIYRFITNVFSLPYGRKVERIIVPKIILDSSKELRKWFVRGIFDGDGDSRATEFYDGRKLPTNRIKLRMKNYRFLVGIKRLLLRDFGSEFKGPYQDKDKIPYIQVHKIDELIKLSKQNLFIHPVKNWRLNKFIEKRMGQSRDSNK